MIPPLLLAAAPVLADLPGGDGARQKACAALADKDPAAAVTQAEQWAGSSPSPGARRCLGLAYVAAARWTPAALTFAQAAEEAESRRDDGATALWTQAGNAALAAGDPAKARTYLDKAIALGLQGALRGEVLLDRARADVALDDPAAARADLDQALALVPKDPFAWLLSATLARRQSAFARAERDIAEAAKLAPDAAAVQLERGNIAGAQGQHDAARQAWTRAAQLAPGSPEGKAAAAALAANQDGDAH